MTEDFKAAFITLTYDLADAIDTFRGHAKDCEHEGRYKEAAIFRQCARLIRRINAGESPRDMELDLRSSFEVFGGDKWGN